jgi:ribosomal protein S19E (S16A)
MTLGEYLARVSHREHLIWVEHLRAEREAEWETPTPEQWYMMAIAAEVRRVLSRNPRDIKVEDFRLRFRTGPQKPVSPEVALAWSKAHWGLAVGLPPEAMKG